MTEKTFTYTRSALTAYMRAKDLDAINAYFGVSRMNGVSLGCICMTDKGKRWSTLRLPQWIKLADYEFIRNDKSIRFYCDINGNFLDWV